MKTTDLIPILLYHLKDGDKYGLELVNACEECSGGKIKFKQPTLYSILKKLEKSRFISSYWKDSDIGGKRHYYKITENGLAQLETYPSLQDLVANIDVDKQDIVEDEKQESVVNSSQPSPFDNFDINSTFNSEHVESVSPFDSFSLSPTKDDAKDIESSQDENSLINEDISPAENSLINEDISPAENSLINEDISPAKDFNYLSSSELNNESQDYETYDSKTSSFDIFSNEDEELNKQKEVFENPIPENYESSDYENFTPENFESSQFETSNYEEFNNRDENLEEKYEDSNDFSNESYLHTKSNDQTFQFQEDSKENNPMSPIETNTETNKDSKNSLEFDIFDALSFSDEDNEKQSSETDANFNKLDLEEDKLKLGTSNLGLTQNDLSKIKEDKFELDNPFFETSKSEDKTEENIEEINENNLKIINEDKTQEFAENKDVETFTTKTKIQPAKDNYKSSLNEIFDTKNFKEYVEPSSNLVDVEYKDYVDLNTDKRLIRANKLKKRKLLKNVTSVFISFLVICLNLLVVIKYSKITPLFCVIHGLTILYLVFYTCNLIGKYKSITYDFLLNKKAFLFKKKLILRIVNYIIYALLILAFNYFVVKSNIFELKNYANLYANLILGAMLFVDYLIAILFYRNNQDINGD